MTRDERLLKIYDLFMASWEDRLREAASDPEKPLTAAERTAMNKFLSDNDMYGGNPSRMAPVDEAYAALEDMDGITDLAKYRTN